MFKRRLIKTLKAVINELEEENAKLKYAVKEKEHNNIILLESNYELRQKVRDLENNLDFIVNDLSAQKKKMLGL